MMPRAVSRVKADTRRVTKGRDERWLRRYIARQAIKMLTADAELRSMGLMGSLSPRMLGGLEVFVQGVRY